jgi:hypothetical protein
MKPALFPGNVRLSLLSMDTKPPLNPSSEKSVATAVTCWRTGYPIKHHTIKKWKSVEISPHLNLDNIGR